MREEISRNQPNSPAVGLEGLTGQLPRATTNEGQILSQERLMMILGGHIFFQTLSSAVQLKLFDVIKEHPGVNREALQELLGLAAKPVRILLLGCTALGLLEKRAEGYYNAPLVDELLTRNAPQSMVPIVEWQHFINYGPMARFADSLRANSNKGLEELQGSGNTLYERLASHPALENIFQEAMQAISRQANAALVHMLDLSQTRHLVDVGGGDGSNLVALARQHPSLRSTVFDSPSVCQLADQHIRKAGLSARVSTHPGDCFGDPFPKGADAFLFCHFFTIWSEDKNRALIQKAYAALPPKGRIIIFNMMQRDDETGPLTAAMGSPYFLTLATGEGMLYTWSEYARWLQEAGFVRVERHELPRDHGLLVGHKPGLV